MRVFIAAAMIWIVTYNAAWANDPALPPFMPLAQPYKTVQGNASRLQVPPPHFFPLPPRHASGKFIMRSAHAATPADEDIPTPQPGPTEAMTQEQAEQIISLFGGGE